MMLMIKLHWADSADVKIPLTMSFSSGFLLGFQEASQTSRVMILLWMSQGVSLDSNSHDSYLSVDIPCYDPTYALFALAFSF